VVSRCLAVWANAPAGNDLYNEFKVGVINEENLGDSKVALVYGQMNEPPGARMRVGLAVTMADIPDVTKQDVLLFIDNIFRFVKLVLRYRHYWVPSAVGLQPTLATKWAICKSASPLQPKGQLRQFKRFTSQLTTDRQRQPRHLLTLDATTVLSRGLASGIYPLLTHWTRLPPCCSRV